MFFRELFKKMATSPILSKIPLHRPFTISVEGNIGSGKTTFLNYMGKIDNTVVLSEPIEFWRNCNGYNLLALMYEDPQKWTFTFQSYVQLTMLKNHTMPTKHSIKLMERSIHSARYCFVEKMKNDGILSPPAFAVIDQWYKWICSNQNVSVDLIVYLRTTPEVVYERILKRNRSEEKTVSFDYIKNLHQMHEDWLYHKTSFNCPSPVFVINADSDLSRMEEEYEKFESQILNSKNISVGV